MGNRKRIIIAAMVAAAVAVVAIILLTRPRSTNSRSPQTMGNSARCPASAESGTIPTAPPTDLEWKGIGSMEVPTSATDGPARHDGDVWTCFAHSPMGAVIAAYDIVGGLLSPQWREVAQQEIAPGAGRQAFIAASQGQTYRPLTPGQIVQPVGFQVVSYTPAQATIETLAAASNDQYQADERTLTWTGGDWKLLTTPDGTIGPDPQLVQSAAGFVLWGGAANG
jgi:hypothetical protein